MKSKIIRFVLLTALSTGIVKYANAQVFELGIRFNPEYSSLINENDKAAGKELDYSPHVSARSFGIGGVYNFTPFMGLAMDILFSREGQAYKGNFDGTPLDPTVYSTVVERQVVLNGLTPIHGDYAALAELNYVKIPLMLSMNSDKHDKMFFTILVGPQVNILEDVAMEVNHTDETFPHTNVKPMDLYKSVTYGAVFAAGTGWNLSKKLTLETRLRFDFGFTDVEKKSVMYSVDGGTPQNFYSSSRETTNNLTLGLMISLDYNFLTDVEQIIK